MRARAGILAIAWLLAACTAPAPQADAALDTDTATAATRTATPARADDAVRPVRRMPPLGGPLPPTRVEDAGCEVDADCAVRAGADGCDRCVPRAALGGTAPAGGATAASCGPQEVEGCRCVDHRCEPRPRRVDGSVSESPAGDAP